MLKITLTDRRTPLPTLCDEMEHDLVIYSHGDGTISDVRGVYAPEVVEDSALSNHWTLLEGFTGQYSYNGPVMHPSEYIGGGLEKHILETEGVYVYTTAYTLEDEHDCEASDTWGGYDNCPCEYGDNIAGWVVAHIPADALEV